MNNNYFKTLQTRLAKEQRQWIIYCQKVKRHGIKNVYPELIKPKNPEEGC